MGVRNLFLGVTNRLLYARSFVRVWRRVERRWRAQFAKGKMATSFKEIVYAKLPGKRIATITLCASLVRTSYTYQLS